MRLRAKHIWFLAFTAVFAVLAGFVFWGTWSTDFAPVMPDSPIVYSPWWLSEWWRGWMANGRFVPGDVRMFLGSPYFWQELNYAIGVYFSALAAFYFLRGRGLSRPAAYGAGLLLAFSGYWFTLYSAGHGSWFTWMTYGLFPFGLIDRAFRKGRLRHWLLLGATVGWAGYWQIDLWLLFTTFIGVYFVFRCVTDRRFPWKGCLIAGVALFAVGSAGFLDAVTNGLAGRDQQIAEGQTVANADSVDETEKRWIFTTNWSLPPDETIEFVNPRVNGDTSCPFTLSIGAQRRTGVTQYTGALGRPKDAPSGNYRQHSLYVGKVTCLLALLGLVSAFLRKPSAGEAAASDRRTILFFAVGAVVFYVFSLGRYCECVYRIVFSLPFGDYLRAPVKWHHLTEFCLAVLAGYGIERLSRFLVRSGRLRRFAPWIIGAVILIGAVDLVRIDRLYCAPVDLREARRQHCSVQMAFLKRSDFGHPQIAAMVKAKRVIPLAQPNPDLYLVEVLEPWKRTTEPLPPLSVAAWLSILSMLSTIAVGVVAFRPVGARRI